jgi:hypothetical protein
MKMTIIYLKDLKLNQITEIKLQKIQINHQKAHVKTIFKNKTLFLTNSIQKDQKLANKIQKIMFQLIFC